MHIPRFYEPIEALLEKKKVLVVFGPRQSGKTTLIEQLKGLSSKKILWDSGDNVKTRAVFESEEFEVLFNYVCEAEILVIDEAQRLPKVGWCLKILVDHRPNLSIVVTGSSSFELAGQIGEPLTGRKRTVILYPVSQYELLNKVHSPYNLKQHLEEFLIYGSYPAVLLETLLERKRAVIDEITNSYLLKDVLELDAIKSSNVLLQLLRLLAFQIGQEVSLNELSNQLDLNIRTVARYLDILEKAFVIKQVWGYSRNLRKEITKKCKYYFYDNGVRNALISNFNPLNIRSDIGQLWENFIFMERLKARSYQGLSANVFFWRTWDKEEVDIVEERGGHLYGYECKWSDKKGQKSKAPKTWLQTYSEATYEVVTSENYLNFVGDFSSSKIS